MQQLNRSHHWRYPGGWLSERWLHSCRTRQGRPAARPAPQRAAQHTLAQRRIDLCVTASDRPDRRPTDNAARLPQSRCIVDPLRRLQHAVRIAHKLGVPPPEDVLNVSSRHLTTPLTPQLGSDAVDCSTVPQAVRQSARDPRWLESARDMRDDYLATLADVMRSHHDIVRCRRSRM